VAPSHNALAEDNTCKKFTHFDILDVVGHINSNREFISPHLETVNPLGLLPKVDFEMLIDDSEISSKGRIVAGSECSAGFVE